AAALLLMFPKTDEEANFIDLWSWVFFLGCLYGSYRKVNPILLIVLSALGGIFVYWLPAFAAQF
ncbi:MAG TPA: chromate transporter, partial [Clostridiales bacterium]|nr:chromate transporter [Clostridiales bacterium]